MKKVFSLFCLQIILYSTSLSANHLTFTALQDYAHIELLWNGETPTIQYSEDEGQTWNYFPDVITLKHKGDKILLKDKFPDKENSFYSFVITDSIAASGNIMSLVDGEGLTKTIPSKNQFSSLFAYCTGLVQAPELPATELTAKCYSAMFYECTSLKQVPELPATTLADSCYLAMFKGCTSLTQVSEQLLPATTLCNRCYESLFSNCENLTNAPALPAKQLASNCYKNMFYSCFNLKEGPELPATTLADSCYYAMFTGCKSLTQAPELPATTLTNGCYCAMFRQCTSLTQVPELSASTLAEKCYHGMFASCLNLSTIKVAFTDWEDNSTKLWFTNSKEKGTFICPEELPLKYGADFIPEGWTVSHEFTRAKCVEAATKPSVRTDGLTTIVNNTNAVVEVYDASGKLIRKAENTNGDVKIDVPHAGVYIVKVAEQSFKVTL